MQENSRQQGGVYGEGRNRKCCPGNWFFCKSKDVLYLRKQAFTGRNANMQLLNQLCSTLSFLDILRQAGKNNDRSNKISCFRMLADNPRWCGIFFLLLPPCWSTWSTTNSIQSFKIPDPKGRTSALNWQDDQVCVETHWLIEASYLNYYTSLNNCIMRYHLEYLQCIKGEIGIYNNDSSTSQIYLRGKNFGVMLQPLQIKQLMSLAMFFRKGS